MIVEVKTWGFVGGKKQARREVLANDKSIDRQIGKMVMDMRKETGFRCDSFLVSIIRDTEDMDGD